MTVITSPGPISKNDLSTKAQNTVGEFNNRFPEIIERQILKCVNDLEARNEDLTVLVRKYLLEQPIPELHHSKVWNFWTEYFMNGVLLTFPFQKQRQGAWALVALSTKQQLLGALIMTANYKLQKCFEALKIPFDTSTDLVTDSSKLCNVLCPRILCQIAKMYELPTDFNSDFGNNTWGRWNTETDYISLVKATSLTVPSLKDFTSDCENKKDPNVIGEDSPYRR